MAEEDPIDVAALLENSVGVPVGDVEKFAVQNDGLTSDAADFHMERLRLARHVLIGLAGIFVFVMIGYVWVSASSHGAEAAKEVFDFVKISFPPIATLILGAYFKGKSD